MAAVACFDVLVFDPKTTVPPITAEIAPIIAIASNLIFGKLVDLSFEVQYLIPQIAVIHPDTA